MTFAGCFWGLIFERGQDIHDRLQLSSRYMEAEQSLAEVEQAFRSKLTEALDKEFIAVSDAYLAREVVAQGEYYMQGFRDGIAFIQLMDSTEAIEDLAMKAKESAPVEAGCTL